MTPAQLQAIQRAKQRVAIQNAQQRLDPGQAMADRNRGLAEAAGVSLEGRPSRQAEVDAIGEQNMARAQISRPAAAMVKAAQGATLGFNDEILGAIGGDEMRDRTRVLQERADTAFPGQSFVAEVGGAVASPAAKVLGPVRSVGSAAKTGLAFGAAEGVGNADGDATDRVIGAAVGGATGMLFGGLSERLGRSAGRIVQRAFQKADERPSVETLKAAKNAAYGAVRTSGVKFDENAMFALNNRVKRKLKLRDFDDIADPQTAAALRVIEARKGQPVTLNRLDRLRQNLWNRYSRSDEPGILDIIEEIDVTIDQAAGANELMAAARDANKKYAKSQLLENAFRKAELQTAATGSGGNILNKYRQAVTRIITNEKEARFFSADELALMESFVEGTKNENRLRLAGKLAPGGNGLMAALSVYASTISPEVIALSGASQLAKNAADRSVTAGKEAVQDAVATGIIPTPTPRPDLRSLSVGGAIAGNVGLNRLIE